MVAKMPATKQRPVADSRLAVDFDAKKIDAIFADVDQCSLPGAAVGIAIAGQPVYRKGFGLANMELPVVLSPSIRMRIGSATKHLTSLAYMLLCEEGRAGIDDSVGKHLPEMHPVTHEITMRQLMAHLSGLREALDLVWQFSGTGRPVSSADLMSLYRDIDDLNAAPGTIWSYNNGAYLMLSAVIERITGQTLEEVLSERVFKPVGMKDTLLRRWDTDFLPNSATLHMTNLAGDFEKSYLGTALAGDGGVVSTVDDMLLWLAHMDAPVVGTVATWKAMRTAQKLANGTSSGYGLGLIVNDYRGIGTLSHGGGVMGGNAQILKVPDACLDIVVMVNRQDVFAPLLVNGILDACLPGLDPVRQAPRVRFPSGTFRSPTTGRVIQLGAQEEQLIASIDGFDWPFMSADDGVLRPVPVWSMMKRTMTLVGDPANPTSIRFSDFGNVDRLERQPPVERADGGAIAGHYRSEATGTDIRICETAHGPRLTSVGRYGSAVYQLECLAERVWRAKPLNGVPWWGGILSFDGSCQSFRFTTLRTWALIFRRET
jgi:D-aminopeptidase